MASFDVDPSRKTPGTVRAPARSASSPAPPRVALSRRSAQVPKAQRAPTQVETFRERVYAWIRRIPRGKVATYGQIAVLAGYPRQARRVGQALGALYSPRDLPWQRVINSQGRVSDRAPRPERSLGSREAEQERLLTREGVKFVQGKTDLEHYRWQPKPRLRGPSG